MYRLLTDFEHTKYQIISFALFNKMSGLPRKINTKITIVSIDIWRHGV